MDISSGSMWNVIIVLSVIVVVEFLLLLMCVFIQCSGIVKSLMKYTLLVAILPGSVGLVVFYYHEPLKGWLPTPVILTEDGPVTPSQKEHHYYDRKTNPSPHIPVPPLPSPPRTVDESSWWSRFWTTTTNTVDIQQPNSYVDDNGCRRMIETYIDEKGDTIHTTKIRCSS